MLTSDMPEDLDKAEEDEIKNEKAKIKKRKQWQKQLLIVSF